MSGYHLGHSYMPNISPSPTNLCLVISPQCLMLTYPIFTQVKLASVCAWAILLILLYTSLSTDVVYAIQISITSTTAFSPESRCGRRRPRTVSHVFRSCCHMCQIAPRALKPWCDIKNTIQASFPGSKSRQAIKRRHQTTKCGFEEVPWFPQRSAAW